MKRYINAALCYAILAMVGGGFYREFTKFAGFTAKTTLSVVHTHYFLLGMVFFLLLLLLEKAFAFTTEKTSRPLVLYHVGLNLMVVMLLVVLFVLFYHKLFAVTFDESFSRATGLRVDWYNTLLAILTALTIVLGMRMMGAMLISSLVIFPALSAMRVRKSFRGVVILAGILSVTCFCAGLTASYLLSTPVGATVVIADLLAFLVCSVVGKK